MKMKLRERIVLSRLKDFQESFEQVFDNDWDMTKSRITDDSFISPSGTFLDPGVEDKSNNWANRGVLLSNYRELLQSLKDCYGGE